MSEYSGDELSGEEGEHDKPIPRVDLDYDEEDGSENRFKKIEKKILDDINNLKNPKPKEKIEEEVDGEEDDMEEEGEENEEFEFETFLERYNPFNIRNEEEYKEFQHRVTYVYKLGIYGGDRDEHTNERHGVGNAIYANGDEYHGKYFEGLKSGTGTYIFKSSKPTEKEQLVYDEFKDAPERIKEPLKQDEPDFMSCAQRLTKYFREKGIETSLIFNRYTIEYGPFPVYIGGFDKDQRDGIGIMKYSNGSIYKGNWKEHQRSGQGEMIYPSGDSYRGEWLAGKKHGEGKYIFKNLGAQRSVFYEGTWKDGEIVEGMWKMNDGVVYVGKFKNGVPNGQGKFIFEEKGQAGNNHQINGVFKNKSWVPSNEFEVVVE